MDATESIETNVCVKYVIVVISRMSTTLCLFVMLTPVYGASMILTYYYKHPSMYKFIRLMKSDNFKALKSLASFILEASDTRKTIIA